jgi:hypothetical protein
VSSKEQANGVQANAKTDRASIISQAGCSEGVNNLAIHFVEGPSRTTLYRKSPAGAEVSAGRIRSFVKACLRRGLEARAGLFPLMLIWMTGCFENIVKASTDGGSS